MFISLIGGKPQSQKQATSISALLIVARGAQLSLATGAQKKVWDRGVFD
jgi:hypothetical protein